MLRNVVLGSEESCVCLDGIGGKSSEVRASDKLVSGLVEADVSVSAYTENLNVNTAESVDVCLVLAAERLNVLCRSVGNRGLCLVFVEGFYLYSA